MISRGKKLTSNAWRALASEVRGLQRAVYVLAVFALLSSVLALLREHIFAYLFGAGVVLDLYNSAFRIPDLLFVLMGALVSVYVLIPQLGKKTHSEQLDYIDTIVLGFSILVIVICSLAALFTPFLLKLFFSKLVAEGHLTILTTMTRIMLLQPILLGFSNILAAITQTKHRYLLYASSQVLYNIGIILGALFLYPLIGVAGLAWGVVFGALVHAGIQVPSIVNDGFFKRVPKQFDLRAILETVSVSIPRALALSMTEIAELGLVFLAGLLSQGSISIFFFAFNLQSVPLTVIGASYSVAAFPGLAAALARGETHRFMEYVATAARYVMFWSLPATALIVVLRAYIVRVILGSGAFNWTDTRLTAAAFALFGLSLAAQSITLLIVRAYYAAGRTFVPFFISTCAAIATIALGAASIGALQIHMVMDLSEGILRVANVPGAQVLALVFAYSFAAIVGAIVLILHFESRFRGFLALVARSWLGALFAALAASATAYLVLTMIGPITLVSTVATVFIKGLIGGAAGIAAACAVYYALGNREYLETLTALKTRIPILWKQVPIAPDVVSAAEEQVS